MDSLREAFNYVGPHIPFMMAAAPGKVKFNGTRITEIMIVLAFLWYQFGELKVDMKEMQDSNHEAIIEFKQDKVKTNQRLGSLEDDMKDVKNVVFAPRGFSKEEALRELKRRGIEVK